MSERYRMRERMIDRKNERERDNAYVSFKI